MIVKVQISITTNAGATQMLIYNKTRSVVYEGDAGQDILDAMKGEKKKYFKATLIDDPNKKGAKRINIIEEAKDQPW